MAERYKRKSINTLVGQTISSIESHPTMGWLFKLNGPNGTTIFEVSIYDVYDENGMYFSENNHGS